MSKMGMDVNEPAYLGRTRLERTHGEAEKLKLALGE